MIANYYYYYFHFEFSSNLKYVWLVEDDENKK